MAEKNEMDEKKMKKLALNQYVMSVNSLNDTIEYFRVKKKYTDEEIDSTQSVIDLRESVELNKMAYLTIGGTEEELTEATKKKRKNQKPKMEKNIMESVKEMEKSENKVEKAEDVFVHVSNPAEVETEDNIMSSYDVIPLPSNGECYKDKKSTIPVSYLTAYDENIIINPNLYSMNLVIDTLLKRKVLDKNVDVDDLLEGDRDAIILFLRSSGYGPEYPLRVKDNETGIEFDTVINLSDLKYKPFNLKSDENGWFDFTLPVSKKAVKFRFLSHRDNMTLNKLEMNENPKLKKFRLGEINDALEYMVNNDNNVDLETINGLKKSVTTLKKWYDEMDDIDEIPYSHRMSNELEYSIMAIDGNTDRNAIHDFVKHMPIKDSTELRQYISKNIPGINYELTIEKPESLGGGSMTVFPQFDQFIFLHRS